ncbi:uncharacterized protein LOC117639607 [Thrips palmi]|uniref:Uncharacterized protein LOC117639607 n=1 Tax=Thrips palmi TaxID=161013 RepID=A0A6P8XWD3_THRPL|nr:uncharacterized protein LOC117639607 [Thrips palmi]
MMMNEDNVASLAKEATILMDNEADLMCASQRFMQPLPPQTKYPPHPKWIGEKHWPLNASNSKELVMGFRLDRMVTPAAALQTPGGLGVSLSMGEFKKLLDPELVERIKDFLKGNDPATTVRLSDSALLKCINMPNQGNIVKIEKNQSGLDTFISLGDVTIQKLFSLSEVLTFDAMRFEDGQCSMAKCVVNMLRGIRDMIPPECQLVEPSQTMQFVKQAGLEALKARERGEPESVALWGIREDLLFRNFETVNLMVFDLSREPL